MSATPSTVLYRHSAAVTAFREFPERSHLLIAQDGWQEIAEDAIAWAERQRSRRAGARAPAA